MSALAPENAATGRMVSLMTDSEYVTMWCKGLPLQKAYDVCYFLNYAIDEYPTTYKTNTLERYIKKDTVFFHNSGIYKVIRNMYPTSSGVAVIKLESGIWQ